MNKQLEERVEELMKQNGLNTNDQMLKMNVLIIYLEAQRDQVRSEKNKLSDFCACGNFRMSDSKFCRECI